MEKIVLDDCIRSAYSFSEDEIRYAVSTQLPDKKLLMNNNI
jgi:hypothetical protein